MWRPKEIFVHEKIVADPITKFFLKKCSGIPVKYVRSGKAKDIVEASDILKSAGVSMLDKILAGKKIVYISPAGDAVDVFTMADNRMVCPHFDRLKLASNGCYYHCDWCYLKLTYRAALPYITVRVQYDQIRRQLNSRLCETQIPIMFNSGELADSLSMEHLTRAGREFIAWFGATENGYLFMLTKSDNVDAILNLPHNGHTMVAWSINADIVSQQFEIGAPSFKRRLEAVYKVQQAGYPIRLRLDPIVPFNDWQKTYSQTIQRIFDRVNPERITIGTLRFEKGFYNMRNSIFTTGSELSSYLADMQPMFAPKTFAGFKSSKSGKYSFADDKRFEIFRFIINEIRKYSDCKIALCKESSDLWNKLGLELSRCSCVCQLDFVDMST
jgi:spore photoproduct lyase